MAIPQPNYRLLAHRYCTGHASAGIILGGSLQLIALGWANVGAAVAPDAALASIASSILMVQSNNFDLTHIMGTIVPAAILLALLVLY